jgi:hypothetical protein
MQRRRSPKLLVLDMCTSQDLRDMRSYVIRKRKYDMDTMAGPVEEHFRIAHIDRGKVPNTWRPAQYSYLASNQSTSNVWKGLGFEAFVQEAHLVAVRNFYQSEMHLLNHPRCRAAERSFSGTSGFFRPCRRSRMGGFP